MSVSIFDGLWFINLEVIEPERGLFCKLQRDVYIWWQLVLFADEISEVGQGDVVKCFSWINLSNL